MTIPAGAALLVELCMLYAGIGLVLGVAFLTLGIARVDPAARGVPAMRPLLLPGIVLLWPLVAWRWWALERACRARGR